MAQQLFHTPDETYFYGSYTFKEARILTDDNEKIEHLKTRFESYYVNGLMECTNPFTISILTCVGIEVLGQVLLGVDINGESIQANTILIYQMLSPELSKPLSSKFVTNYNLKRNVSGQSYNYANSFPSYANVLRKGLRNAFTHSYRPLGVFLDSGKQDLMVINEDEGYLAIDFDIFRKNFIICFNDSFSEILSNKNLIYKANALRYFDLLIK